MISSPLTSAVAELNADAGIRSLKAPVRAFEPAPGDAKGPSEYQRFIVVNWLDGMPRRRLPIRMVVLGVRSYGKTPADAEAMGMAVEAVFHDKGARTAASGLGTWHSYVSASGPETDPDTRQPLWHSTIEYPVTRTEIAT